MNRYYGWYTDLSELKIGYQRFSDEPDALYARYHKPLILTEFGADMVAGRHAEQPEMFSEEYHPALRL